MRAILFIAALSVMVTTIRAAEMPKAGEDSFTTAFVVTSAKTTKFGERSLSHVEFSGISTNDKGSGMFHNIGTRCAGIRELNDTKVYVRGTCADTDQDGDQFFTIYEATASDGKPPSGIHQFVGGTGKYSGISGKADYTVQYVKSSDGPSLFLAFHKASWKLP